MTRRTVWVTCCVVLALALLQVPILSEEPDLATVTERTVHLHPDRIILNAKLNGSQQDIRATVLYDLTGYQITDFEIYLQFDGCSTAFLAHSFRITAEGNCEAIFYRVNIHDDPEFAGLAGTTVEATVAGTFSAVRGEYNRDEDFTGSDYVQVVDPEKR